MLLNPFRINDWKILDTLKAVFILQFIVLALVGLDDVGIRLPLVRALTGVAYMLFVPGILILRVIRAHGLSCTRTVLFSVGLSIATIMFVGLFVNVVYPLLGIELPLGLASVVGTMTIIVMLLAAASFWRDRNFVDQPTLDWQRMLTPSVLVLCLLPFISILATYAMNIYGTNLALLGLLVVIAAIALWIGVSSSISKESYPLAVFAIALAMLFFASLISSNVWGWDSQKELYSANLVLTSGVWNPALTDPTNAVASITVLAPFLSLISGVSVMWLFKIVYPLVFALVPLALFVTVRSQTNDKVAFLSAFFVSLLFTFFGEMPALARQEIAELFLVLLLVLTVDKYRSVTEKRRVYVLFVAFASSLIVSHYALAFIYLAYISVAWLLLFLVDNPALSRLRRSVEKMRSNRPMKPPQRMLTLVFVVAFAIFTAAWYLSFGSAASAATGTVVAQIFHKIPPRTIAVAIGIGGAIYVSALTLIYVFTARRLQKTGTWPWLYAAAPLLPLVALRWWTHYDAVSFTDVLQVGTLSPLHELGLALYVLSVLMIVVGLGALSLRRFRWSFDGEYVALALASFAVLFTATIIPLLAFSINTTRLFHVSTIMLAPFCVTGALIVAQSATKIVFRKREKVHEGLTLKLVVAFFVTLFLFNSGFVYEVTHQGSASFVLNGSVDAPLFNDREVAAGQWLNDTRGSGASGGGLIPIYADAHRRALFDRFDLYHPATYFLQPVRDTPRNSYVFLGTFNVERGQVAQIAATTLLKGTEITYVNLSGTTGDRGKIFDDGGAVIYYRRPM
ncbi:MAG: DUF2206 domain-containing protein [Halobacteriota archaeon]